MFPNLPVDDIRRELEMTGSVDTTIDNLLRRANVRSGGVWFLVLKQYMSVLEYEDARLYAGGHGAIVRLYDWWHKICRRLSQHHRVHKIIRHAEKYGHGAGLWRVTVSDGSGTKSLETVIAGATNGIKETKGIDDTQGQAGASGQRKGKDSWKCHKGRMTIILYNKKRTASNGQTSMLC